MNKYCLTFFCFLTAIRLFSSPWTENNSVVVSRNGEETLKYRIKLIEQATDYLLWSFNFAGGDVFDQVLAKIHAQMFNQEELKTFLLISSDFLNKNNKILLGNLKKIYPDRFHYLIVERQIKIKIGKIAAVKELHVKLQIATNNNTSIVGIGGSGLTDAMAKTGLDETDSKPLDVSNLIQSISANSYRDSDVFVEGPLNKQAFDYFVKLYDHWQMDEKTTSESTVDIKSTTKYEIETIPKVSFLKTFPHAAHGVKARLLYTDPHEKFFAEKDFYGGITSKIEHALVKEIGKAKNSVIFANMYFFPPQRFLDFLMGIKEKNSISLTLISNSGKSDAPVSVGTFYNLNRKNYCNLSKVYEYTVPGVMYHKKVTLIDDDISFIGSFNLGPNSFDRHDEAVIQFKNKEVNSLLMKDLEDDMARSRVSTIDSPEASFAQSVMCTIQSLIFEGVI